MVHTRYNKHIQSNKTEQRAYIFFCASCFVTLFIFFVISTVHMYQRLCVWLLDPHKRTPHQNALCVHFHLGASFLFYISKIVERFHSVRPFFGNTTSKSVLEISRFRIFHLAHSLSMVVSSFICVALASLFSCTHWYSYL